MTGVQTCALPILAGWSLYLEAGVPVFLYNCYGRDLAFVRGRPLRSGARELVVEFAYDGGFGAGGTVTLAVDGETVAGARIERTVPIVFSMSGETFDVGCDTGSPVGPYPDLSPCTARIAGVTLERLSEPGVADRERIAELTRRAGLVAQ